jgi:hypothetical protein
VAAGVAEATGAPVSGLPTSPGKAAALNRAASAAQGAAMPVLPEGAEVSLLYVRFRAAAEPQLKGGDCPPPPHHTACSFSYQGRLTSPFLPTLPHVSSHESPPPFNSLPPSSSLAPPPPKPAGLFSELEQRSQRAEYARLLEECRALYCQTRQQVVQPFVGQRVAALADAPLPQLLRAGCDQLARLAAAEVRRSLRAAPQNAWLCLSPTTTIACPLVAPLPAPPGAGIAVQ